MQKVTNRRNKKDITTADNDNKANTLKRGRGVEGARERGAKRRTIEPTINNSLENDKDLKVRDVKRNREEKGTDSVQGSPKKKMRKSAQTKSEGVEICEKRTTKGRTTIASAQNDVTKNSDILALPRQYFKEGKYDEAVQVIEQELNTPGLGKKAQLNLHFTLALVYFMKGNDLSFSADDQLNTALVLLYHDTESYSFKEEKCKFYYKLSMGLLKKSDYARAEKAARLGIEVKRMDSLKSELYLCLSKSCLLQEKYIEASEAAMQGLEFISNKKSHQPARENFGSIIRECKFISSVPSNEDVQTETNCVTKSDLMDIDYFNQEGIYSQDLETYLETEGGATSSQYSSSTAELEAEIQEYFQFKLDKS